MFGNPAPCSDCTLIYRLREAIEGDYLQLQADTPGQYLTAGRAK